MSDQMSKRYIHASVQGLYLYEDFLSPEVEQTLIEYIDRQPWDTRIKSRRVQQYGCEYNYRKKKDTGGNNSPPLSGPLKYIRDYLHRYLNTDFNSLIVNEYYRGQGIAAHVDSLSFGPVVVGISIGDPASMKFELYKSTEEPQTVNVYLPRRSLMIMTNESRYNWKHSIPKTVTTLDQNGRRISKPDTFRRLSLTYRTSAV